MSDTLIGSLRPDGEGSEESMGIAHCDVCQTRLPPNGLFCSECGPPLPPGEEPEEVGTTPEQAFLRICALLTLFLAVAVVKLDISFDSLFFSSTDEEWIEPLTDMGRPQDGDFQIIHSVNSPYANVRAKPSLKSTIITVVEQGMRLEILEDNGRWSKIRVFGKTGWISNKLLKSEVREPE